MKIAHLILAHNNPAQLARLVNRLNHPDADIYIHLDLKAAIEPFLAIVKLPQVHFIKKRQKVYWGSYSIVQATLNSFQEILANKKGYQYINLLSGNDYPIKSVAQIHQFFDDRPDYIFMEYLTEDSEWWQSNKTRVTQYHLTDFNFPGYYLLQTFLNKILPNRKAPNALTYAGRSQWLTLSTDSAQYVIDYLHKHTGVARFFRLTWAPDEIAIQTILYNSPFKDQIINCNYRYTDWSENKASPKTLTMDDAPKLLNSDCLYARKFDMDSQPEIMDYLDNKL
ncbi:beta-1,6-N-acetylglucosaminyltransferase [Mucilaginibacter paludis]|uniref:Peptide O-xylosyltransferase n=1 Tax=Mucilaginibacter paludis DSM 18603 TaxID=714943 RepID=H1Y210_9SPHI|nr:beta-1,6-N-acetylglucosaminyltransferase [Mucilaginibacter paludis]EHQ25713.1 glycosyl transferase family 14 [Mucilaginibacter paludis DSM 18603]